MKTEVFTVVNNGALKFTFRKSLKAEQRNVLNNRLKDVLSTKLESKRLMVVGNVLTYYNSPMDAGQTLDFLEFLHTVNNADNGLLWDSMVKNK